MNELALRYAPPVPVTSGNALRRVARGFVYPLRGLRLLWRHTELWPWASAPFLITAWMIVGAGWLTLSYTDDVVSLVFPPPEAHVPADAVRVIVWNSLVTAIGVVVFLVLAVVSWILGNMLASPFYDVLANKIERLLLDRHDEDFNLRVVLGDAWMSIRHSALALLLYVLIEGPLLLLNLIPVVGSAAYTVLSTSTTVFFLARELMDIPLSHRRVAFLDKLRFLSRHKALMAGLGLSGVCLLAVPGLNLVVMPVAVMGATLLFVHLELEGQGLPQSSSSAAASTPHWTSSAREAP